jgi:hypothetical protein
MQLGGRCALLSCRRCRHASRKCPVVTSASTVTLIRWMRPMHFVGRAASSDQSSSTGHLQILSFPISPDFIDSATPTKLHQHDVQAYRISIRWIAMVRVQPRMSRLSDTNHCSQENPMATFRTPESATAQASQACRQSRGYRQYCTSEERGSDSKGNRALVQGDAARGGNAAKGQIHHF